MKRTLRLRTEVLTELVNDELEAVVAGRAVTIVTLCYGVSCPFCPHPTE